MRPITTAYQKILDAPNNERTVRAIVEIDRTGSGAWVDLSDLHGKDWIESISYEVNLSAPVGTARIVLRRGDLLSLSPWMESSQANVGGVLCQPGRDIRIKTAVVPYLTNPVSSDYIEVFTGKISDLDLSGDKISLRCRDQGGRLQDDFIEETRFYGADSGALQVEGVIQDILDDWSTGGLTLYSVNGTGGTPFNAGDSPGWAIKKYEQQRMPAMNAIKVLADQIGHDLRFRYQQNTGDIQLVLSEPDRSTTTAAHTFGKNQYMINSIKNNLSQIRNVVRASYVDKSGRRQTVEASNPASITKYGRLFMEINEGDTSQIDTFGEMNTMVTGIVNDLKDPLGEYSITVPYFYVAELGDLYQIDADGVFSDQDRKLGLQSIQHTISAGTAQTSLVLQGFPTSKSPRKWGSYNANYTTVQVTGRNTFRDGLSTGSVIRNGMFGQWSRG